MKARLTRAAALAPLLFALVAPACGDPFTLSESGATSGGGSGPTGSGSTASGVPAGEGCADGEREAFVDTKSWPDVAGCAGGFQVPGVAAGEPLVSTCGRAGGDDSNDPNGQLCSALDLCSDGWHVCNSAGEFAGLAPNGCDFSADGFFVTRQSQGNDVCQGPPAVNNLVGCGSIGRAADMASCSPLGRSMRYDDCLATQRWHCGSDVDQAQEGRIVYKDGPEDGGVLCCRDGT